MHSLRAWHVHSPDPSSPRTWMECLHSGNYGDWSPHWRALLYLIGCSPSETNTLASHPGSEGHNGVPDELGGGVMSVCYRGSRINHHRWKGVYPDIVNILTYTTSLYSTKNKVMLIIMILLSVNWICQVKINFWSVIFVSEFTYGNKNTLEALQWRWVLSPHPMLSLIRFRFKLKFLISELCFFLSPTKHCSNKFSVAKPELPNLIKQTISYSLNTKLIIPQ